MIVFYAFLTAFGVSVVVYLYLFITGVEREKEEKRQQKIKQEVNKVLNPPGSDPYPKR